MGPMSAFNAVAAPRRHIRAKDVGTVESSHDSEEPIMQVVITIGLDIAKSVFRVHGIDAESKVAHPPSAEAPLRAAILPEAAVVPG